MDKLKEYKERKKIADTKHKAKMEKMLKDAILLKTKDDNYIKINNDKLTDALNKQITEMITLTGEVDPNKILTKDMIDLNLLSIYDANDQIIGYDITDIKHKDNTKDKKGSDYEIQVSSKLEQIDKGQDYWENQSQEYLERLKERDKIDITNLSKKELTELIVENNKDYIINYFLGIKANNLDLADEKVRLTHAIRITDSIRELQLREIKKIGYDTFLNNSVYDLKDKINVIIHTDILEDIRQDILNVLETLHIKGDAGENKGHTITISLLRQHINKVETIYQKHILDNQYLEDKEFYDKRHNTIEQIDKLINKISKKYKQRLEYLNTPRYRAMDINPIQEMQEQKQNIDNLSLTTTLVGDKIFKETFKSGEQVNVPIAYKDRATKLMQEDNIFITLTDANAMDITLKPEHKVISDRVGTMLNYNVSTMTARRFYNFINKGRPTDDYVDNDKLKELNKTLNEMTIWGEIDATEQFNKAIYNSRLKQYNIKNEDKGSAILHQQMLSFKYLEYELPNGDVMFYYKFLDKPLFYQYAEQLQQIAVVPADVYDINSIPNKYKKTDLNTGFKYKTQITENTSVIRDKLVKRIELMKSKENYDIVINTFLAECDFKDLDKQASTSRKKSIESILNNWILKDYIKGYRINRNGKIPKYSISIYITDAELKDADTKYKDNTIISKKLFIKAK